MRWNINSTHGGHSPVNYTRVLWCLIIVGFFVRVYMAYIDPFPHIWDERFHALVARNMMDAPFRPVLRINPVFPANPYSWTQGSLWLHKPPLFMWQMALSMKIFGSTVYAFRYPGIVMGTLMIPMVYSTVKSVTRDEVVAIITAFLFCFSNFHLELVAGIRSMDQNDLTLECYVLASVWAWVKYEEKKQWYWIPLIGIFAGAAILTKWLIGLFVYLVWAMKILLDRKEKANFSAIGKYLISLSVCCIIFLPWQYYIISNFPLHAAIEYDFNRRHITEALEGHEGNIFFYLARFPHMFGEGIFLLIFPGIFLWYRAKRKDSKVSLSILLGCAFVFLFFSVVVKTKVISHMFFIAPFLMLLLAYSVAYLCRRWFKKAYWTGLFFLAIFVLDAKPEKIVMHQSTANVERNNNISNVAVYKKVARQIGKGSVVINAPDYVSFMFFNKGIAAYDGFSQEQLELLQKRKVKIVAFDNVLNRPLPGYILHYPYLTLLHDQLK